MVLIIRRKIRLKMEQMPGMINDDGYDKIKDFKAFDDRYTAPINGFKDAEDYWFKCSSGRFLHAITIPTLIVNAQDDFFSALKGKTDPEEKREAITHAFYKVVFGKLVKESRAKFLLQGTNYTDVEETVAGIKRQHNVFEQLGIDTQQAFGYRILEPLIRLRKDGVRMVGRALGLPESIFTRIPFPGPALAARVIGEVTPEKIKMVRKATAITEAALAGTKAFQYMAILHDDKVTGMRGGKRVFGNQIEIRCWNSPIPVRRCPKRLRSSRKYVT
jgi:GMP synthase (glutamine-hydrolysing)